MKGSFSFNALRLPAMLQVHYGLDKPNKVAELPVSNRHLDTKQQETNLSDEKKGNNGKCAADMYC